MPHEHKKKSGSSLGAAFAGGAKEAGKAGTSSKDMLRSDLRTMNYDQQQEALRPPKDGAYTPFHDTPNFYNEAAGNDRYRDFNPIGDPNLIVGGGRGSDGKGGVRGRGQGGYTLTSDYTSNSSNNSGIDGSPSRNLNIDDILAAFGAMGRQDIASFIKSSSGKPDHELLRELAWWCFSNSQDPDAIRDGLQEAGEIFAYLDFDTYYAEFGARGVKDLKDKEVSSSIKTGLSSNVENGAIGGESDVDRNDRSTWTTFVFDGKGGGVELKSSLVAAYYEEVDQVRADGSLARWERVRTGNGNVYFACEGKPVTAKSDIPRKVWSSAAGDLGKGEDNLVQVRNDQREHGKRRLANGSSRDGYAPFPADWNITWREFK